MAVQHTSITGAFDAERTPRPWISLKKTTDDATPVKHRALSLALDAVNIRLDTVSPHGALYRRLLLQKRALEALAGVPRLYADGGRS